MHATRSPAKRAIDVVVGVPLALISLPVIGVLAVAVAISLRCWPFFVQERIGTGGRLFRFLKLRTLPASTPVYASKLHCELRASRLTELMRRTHLDELPQLLSVPLGRLSLVGPRPRMPDECDPAQPVHASLRVLVSQGCTGLWQVGEHNHLRIGDAPEYDLFYLRHGSLRMDLWILWRTFLKLAGIGRPRSLDDVPAWTHGNGFLHEKTFEGTLHVRSITSAIHGELRQQAPAERYRTGLA